MKQQSQNRNADFENQETLQELADKLKEENDEGTIGYKRGEIIETISWASTAVPHILQMCIEDVEEALDLEEIDRRGGSR